MRADLSKQAMKDKQAIITGREDGGERAPGEARLRNRAMRSLEGHETVRALYREPS